MTTTTLIKTVLSCTGVVGGVCAISIPAAVKVSSSKRTAGEISKPKILLSKCEAIDPNNNKEIGYGSDQIQEICWKLANESGDAEENFGEEYTNLFREAWTIKESRGEDWVIESAKQWTTVCMDDTNSQWLLPNSQSGPQYLGLCGDSKLSETKFIKKQREEGGEDGEDGQEVKTPRFWACTNDCWDISSKQEKSEKWREIKFYQKLEIENKQVSEKVN